MKAPSIEPDVALSGACKTCLHLGQKILTVSSLALSCKPNGKTRWHLQLERGQSPKSPRKNFSY